MSTKVITSEVRFSYAHVWEPSAVQEGQAKKYSVSILISKDDTELLAKVKSGIKAAYDLGITKCFGGKAPAKGTWKVPLRDGDLERPDNPEYENCWFVNASSLTAPTILEPTKHIMVDQDNFYSGCYGKVSVNFYPFNKAGGKGVACGLNNILKTRDGDPLGEAKASAHSDFGLPEDVADDFM